MCVAQPRPRLQLGLKEVKDDIAKEIAAILDPKTTSISGPEELAINACKRLFLYDNKITPDGATALAEMLKNNNVLEEVRHTTCGSPSLMVHAACVA